MPSELASAVEAVTPLGRGHREVVGELGQAVHHLRERALERARVLELGANAEPALDRDNGRDVAGELVEHVLVDVDPEPLPDRLLAGLELGVPRRVDHLGGG